MPCAGTYLGGCCGEIPEGILFKRVVLTASAYNPGGLTPGIGWVQAFLAEAHAALVAEPYPDNMGYSTLIDYARADGAGAAVTTRIGPTGPFLMPVSTLLTANGGFVETSVAGTPTTAVLRFFNLNLSKFTFQSRGWLRAREVLTFTTQSCELLPRTDDGGNTIVHAGELLPPVPEIDLTRPGANGWGTYFIKTVSLAYSGTTVPTCP